MQNEKQDRPTESQPLGHAERHRAKDHPARSVATRTAADVRPAVATRASGAAQAADLIAPVARASRPDAVARRPGAIVVRRLPDFSFKFYHS